jgi:uncharacterized membrane protein
VFDAARGIAVLAMVQWHVVDAWTVDALRTSRGFGVHQQLGGFAAPAFILLAGLGLGLASPIRPDVHDTVKSSLRGIRIVLAGYALALFGWAVDHSGLSRAGERVSILAAALGLLGLSLAIRDRPRSPLYRMVFLLAGGGAFAIAISRSEARIEHLLRRDVLHGIGAALIATSLVLHATRMLTPQRRVAFVSFGAASVATLAVPMTGIPARFLPAEWAGWIARESANSWGFPLFPWLAYALLGAAFALAIRARPFELSHRFGLPHVAFPPTLIAVAIVLAAFSFEPSPMAQFVLERAGDLRSLFRLVFNASTIAISCGMLALLGQWLPRWLDILCLLGRHSLVLYCVHLEFVYGLVGVPLQHTLHLEATWIGAVVISSAMIALAYALENGTQWRREYEPFTIARSYEHARTYITRLANGLGVWLHR